MDGPTKPFCSRFASVARHVPHLLEVSREKRPRPELQRGGDEHFDTAKNL